MNTLEVSMKRSEITITVSTLLLAGGIVAGAGIRLAHLGMHPLSDSEARLAMQAYQTAVGQPSQWSGHPLYLILTSLLFRIFEDTNFTARLVPALAGIALLFLPVLHREKLGKLATVLAVWLLAIEPAMVAASRLAGSNMLALTLMMYTISMLLQKRSKTAAVLLGFTLLTGPSLWLGIILLVMATLCWFVFNQMDHEELFSRFDFITPTFWAITAVVFGLTSVLFMIMPQGISSFAGSLVDFLGYWRSGGVDIRLALLALPLYTPLVLIAGVVGVIHAFKGGEPFENLLSWWIIVAFLGVICLPGRSLYTLIWVTLPLAILASRQLTRIFAVNHWDAGQAMLIAGFVALILLFIWQVFGTLNQDKMDMKNFLIYSGAALLILVICALLAVLGWSVKVTGLGYAWAFSLALTLFTLMSTWRSAGISTEIQKEFWNNGNDPTEVMLLEQTVRDMSGEAMGGPDGLQVVTLGQVQSSVAWALRHQDVREVDGLAGDDSPDLVITPMQADLTLAKAYRGQDFTIRSQMDFNSMTVQDWMKWLMIRKVPTNAVETDILWARGDLFPGYRPILPAGE